MKQHISMPKGRADELQWLYSPDWVYHDYGDCKRHLQVIFPYRREMRADERYPLILYIPGSAWRRQEMYNDVTQLARLARRGFVIAMMEYREADIAPFPAQVEDVRNALQFIPTIAENFHIDAGRVFLMGNSSGGHVAMMAALLNAHGLCAPLPEIAGVICESGSTDLLLCARSPLPPWMKQRPSALLLGVDAIEGHEEEARRASCGMYVTPEIKLPPVLLIHSEHDPVVSAENSRTLCEQLEDAGHQVTYIELRDCDAHGGAAFFDSAVLDAAERFCKGQTGTKGLTIRPFTGDDIAPIVAGECAQGWHATEEKYISRLQDAADGKCIALCAEWNGEPVGYISVYPDCSWGAFGDRGWPEIIDFAVLQKARRHGVGTALMDAAERIAADFADHVYLGVGLHEGYGAAQRMYVKRGYVPDGSGVWYGDRVCPQYEGCCNDDDLVLYLYKRLK